ncbi:hypothetical protein E5K00_03970 [Hymenobacter aquaticus]|uniref:Uncharacterized protein n=1 Tax=Hymenobacter aquaticus TaxID=1867101 RepID=A0A4Z0Q5F6_9BACT|nr:hypothetical protein E5K00_03970 [Hymenobacter aquaticus]
MSTCPVAASCTTAGIRPSGIFLKSSSIVLVLGAWCLVLGAWCLVLGAWCLVLGAWCLVLGAWCLETGTPLSILSTKHQTLLSILTGAWECLRPADAA